MERVKLGDVAIEKRETWTGSIQGVPIVGLEHLVPGEVTLSSWDSDSDNTFSKMFRKGQVLLGRRRVYLKKAVIAPFDGICSGDITVIEAIPGKISARLLPFVIQNERFFDYAMQGSAGSLSPRVKWEHLKDYEFNLPDYEEQDCLADKLWSALKLRESYQSLLQATDEMVKSRFIEMFETTVHVYEEIPITALCYTDDDIKCGPFGTQLKQSEYQENGVAVWGIPQINSGFSIAPDTFVTPEKAKRLEQFSLISGDIAMSRKGNVGQCALFPDNFEKGIIASDVVRIRVNKDLIMPQFLVYQLHNSHKVRRQILNVSDGSIMAGINVTKLKKIHVYSPPLERQKQFVSIVRQVDKSKFELKQAIEKIDKVMRALIQ